MIACKSGAKMEKNSPYWVWNRWNKERK
jgi:hypothetical protein